jgi:hypothetical protein
MDPPVFPAHHFVLGIPQILHLRFLSDRKSLADLSRRSDGLTFVGVFLGCLSTLYLKRFPGGGIAGGSFLLQAESPTTTFQPVA